MRTIVATALLALLAAPLSAAEPITGRWLTESRDAIVEIAPCGGKLCGTITRFLVKPKDGDDQRDANNKDPRLRSRKLLGMAILTGFTADGDVWRGQIYDPRSGKTYRSILRRNGAGGLSVQGCVGPFCQTQNWRRAP